MILIDEPGYKLTWTSPIPTKDGVPLTREELIELFYEKYSIRRNEDDR